MYNDVLMLISIFVSLATLVTFVVSMRKEAEKRGARQADLDNAIAQIKDTIKQLADQIIKQHETVEQLKLWMELLLQQHHANHNQEIRRAK